MSLLLTLLFFLTTSLKASPWSYHFNDDLEGWGTWGDGLVAIDKSHGKNAKGSLRLETDYGNTQTIHLEKNNLPPGFYRISFYVRAQGILSDEKNYSFWHFIDKGNGTEDLFTNLSGSFEWRKIEYSIELKNSKLLLWFRLKSTGRVWLDDLVIQKVSAAATLEMEPAKPFKETVLPQPSFSNKLEKKVLIEKMGSIKPHEFYNLSPSTFDQGNWEKFDFINLDVFNPNDQSALFTMALGDTFSRDYWTQLNHKSSLAPGLNRLSFPLKQFIGERGSHRFQRYLDLKALKKWFINIDPDKTKNLNQNFTIENISLEQREIVSRPVGVWSFDFTSLKNDIPTSSTKVYSLDQYSNSKGYGFVEPEFWRVEDSVYAPNDLRYSIGLLKGHFKVRLPNGKYTLFFNIERLGYWDVSFWSNREIYLNDKIVFKETRASDQDYLLDYLTFSTISPQGEDHPYDLYLDKIFRYLQFEVEVTKGELVLSFLADATGISLNHLVIATQDKKDKALDYISQLKNARKKEFNRISRKITVLPLKEKPQSKLIDLRLDLREDQTYPETSKNISWVGVKGESLYQVIELRGSGNVSFQVKGKDETFLREHLKIFEVVPQIISPDLNHETYFYGGKFLRPFTKLSVSDGSAKFILIELTHQSAERKQFSGQLEIKVGKETSRFPLELETLPFELPRIDFPVGYFGPDPLQLNYVSSETFSQSKEEYRFLAIQKLAEAGFTTFTGLPSEFTALSRLVKFANRVGMGGTYFSYGGDFPGDLLNQDETYLYSLIDKLDAKLVHTFSDEPGGYSNKIQDDLETAKKLKKDFPILLRGGFTNLNDKTLNELNSYFDYPFYSHVNGIIPVKGWGAYNAAAGNLDDPRFVLSAGLYYARKRGLTHYLEWHSSAIHNYPYYDLDGRESDNELFIAAPQSNLYPTLKFIMARQGIQAFRKTLLLDEKLKLQYHEKSKAFIRRIEQGYYTDRTYILMPSKHFDFGKFQFDLNESLKILK